MQALIFDQFPQKKIVSCLKQSVFQLSTSF